MSDRVPPHRARHACVELLSGIDAEGSDPPREFYDRLCEAMCRLTSMERAGLLLYDDARKLVLPVGSHGVEPDLLKDVYGTLDETPIAQRALAEDRVVEASEELEREIPGRYASLGELTTLTCTPVSAGRPLARRRVRRPRRRAVRRSREPERDTMWTLGKLAALAASARIATAEHARARLLGERIDLAREVHERVMQRLFGVSLVLGAELELGPAERGRAAEEIAAAVSDLRSAMARPVDARPRGTGAGLREELERLSRHYDDTPLARRAGPRAPRSPMPSSRWPSRCWRRPCATPTSTRRPTRVDVSVAAARTATFSLEVRNDGADAERARPGQRHGPEPGGAGRAAAGRGGGVRPGRGRGVARAAGCSGGRSLMAGLRVLVVDDHDVVHWGLRTLLTEQPWVERCLDGRRRRTRRAPWHAATSPTWRWWTCSSASASGAELCATLRQRVALARASC